jgi:cytoskeletal protein CcmA (bactofilin family)
VSTPTAAAPAAPVPPVPAPPTPADLSDRGVVARALVRARRWSLRGTGKVEGDVTAAFLDSDGLLVVGGTVRAGEARLHGSTEVTGAIEVTALLDCSGSLRGGSGLKAGDLRAAGRLRTAGAVEVQRTVEVRGALQAPMLTATALTLRGSCEIPGTVKAASADLELERASSVGTVLGERVTVRLRGPNPIERVFGREVAVRIERIEAEAVSLERVEVEFVRAKEVRLGPEAHVTTVEGTVVDRHRTSRIGPESRSPPPPGLRR